MNKRCWLFFFLLILILTGTINAPVNAHPEAALGAKGTLCIYTISGEKYVRDTNAVQYSLKDLKAGEYLSFNFKLTNYGAFPLNNAKKCARINGGECLEWGRSTLNSGSVTNCHIFYVHMKNYGPGTYDVDFYVNDELIESQTFTILNGWNDKMSLPSRSEINAFSTSRRSPYIEIYPDFPSEGFTQYAVDFRADHLPRGTYLSVLNWNMTPGSLGNKYRNITKDGPTAYAGFQNLYDGTHVAILSVWDTYCTDKNGKKVTIRAERIYPDSCIGGDTFGGEGEGVHCIVPYDWKEGHSYRALIQQGTAPNGNTTVVLWACDLETGQWRRLIEYDMKRTDTHMTWGMAFLENYLSKYAGELRSMALSNIRVLNSSSHRWTGIKTASFKQNYDHPGSYNYGSEGSVFWAVTTGLKNRCNLPAQGKRFSVQTAAANSPF